MIAYIRITHEVTKRWRSPISPLKIKEPSVIWLQKHGVDFKGDVRKVMEMSIFPTDTVNTSWIK